MKKIIQFIMLFMLIIVTGCSNNALKKISINELNEKLKNNETFIIYFTKDDEDILENKLIKVLEDNNLTGFKIDSNKITNEEKLLLQTQIDYETPSIVFIINGKDPSKLAHVTSDEITNNQLIQRLKDMNYIK